MSEASAITVAVASEEEVRTIALRRRMREHNYRIVGKYPEGQNVWLNARDPEGNEEAQRSKGIGSRLLGEGEAHARKLGATRARVDTFEWQAPAFYLKHGYRELLRWPDYYQGHASSLMVKDL